MFLQNDATLRVVAWKSPYYLAVWTHGPDRNHLSPPSDVIINGRRYNANSVFISINSTYIVVSYLLITVLRSNETYVLNVFINIQTSKELIQMDTDKMMTYGTFTMDDEKHMLCGSVDYKTIHLRPLIQQQWITMEVSKFVQN